MVLNDASYPVTCGVVDAFKPTSRFVFAQL
ncbi:hypothetical protein AVEN_149277-1, partial [Araneus ventricosus]